MLWVGVCLYVCLSLFLGLLAYSWDDYGHLTPWTQIRDGVMVALFWPLFVAYFLIVEAYYFFFPPSGD